jgi:outer membrane protein OmpA-like peptidoglycan-associated protein
VVILAAVLGGALGGCAGSARRQAVPLPAAAQPDRVQPDRNMRAVAELAVKIGEALTDCPTSTANGAVSVAVPGSRLFETDGIALRADGEVTLAGLARVLRGCHGCTVEIVGHTDAIGPAAANLQFSAQRAEALADWMRSAGVSAARLQARGAGEAEPVADESTPAGRTANRRIEIIIRP